MCSIKNNANIVRLLILIGNVSRNQLTVDFNTVNWQVTGKLLANHWQITGKSELEGFKVQIESDVFD